MAFHVQECSRLAQTLSECETQQRQELTRRQEQLTQVAHSYCSNEIKNDEVLSLSHYQMEMQLKEEQHKRSVADSEHRRIAEEIGQVLLHEQ